MADEKSHTEQGQIERAQRLRRVIENLKTGQIDSKPSSEDKSLREEVEERARTVAGEPKQD